MRLARIRAMVRADDGCRALLVPLDRHGLLQDDGATAGETPPAMEADELYEALRDSAGGGDLGELRHVRASADRRTVGDIADRALCRDFDELFKPLFELARSELKAGIRQSRRFKQDASVERGNFFILNGQLVYVAAVGEPFKAPNGDTDARMRVIYANGTESNLLRRSLQRALYKDEAGRRVTAPDAGPLFAGTRGQADVDSGTIYVLRSLSDHEFIAAHRDLIHKIGVTSGKVEARIAGAEREPTYLLAGVTVVAEFALLNIDHRKMERLFHRIFAPAQIDITITDRFGRPVKPKEWFLVPLPIIKEAVDRIKDGSIAGMAYDPETASLHAA